jgi:hypothetical protein
MNARESENYLPFHAHPVHQNSVEFFSAEIYRGRLFLGSNLVSFNRTLVVPYEIRRTEINLGSFDSLFLFNFFLAVDWIIYSFHSSFFNSFLPPQRNSFSGT